MAPRHDFPRDIGEFIRDLRRNARISLRQLAAQAGVSNPYLSQIERGLRRPSAEVLAQLASALRVSTPLMYLRAGLLSTHDGQGVLAAIAGDPDLTIPQKQSLTQIYETFRRENARLAGEAEPVHVPRRIEIEVPHHGPPATEDAQPGTDDAPRLPATTPRRASSARRSTAAAAKRAKAGAPAAKAASKRTKGARSVAVTRVRPTGNDDEDLSGTGNGADGGHGEGK